MRPRSALVGELLLLLTLGAGPAAASTSFDFLFNVSHVGDDNQYFLNLAVGHYGYTEPVLVPVLPRIVHVEADLPVLLFLAEESGRPIEGLVAMRADGLSWSVIFGRVGVPIDVLFVGIDRDPGPPYGKAWGYWKKNPRSVRLSDPEIGQLVSLQIGHQISGISTFELARARSGGKPVAVSVADRKGRSYGGGPAKAQAGGKGKSGSKGKAGGKGKGHAKTR
jgi:hypothetical protein